MEGTGQGLSLEEQLEFLQNRFNSDPGYQIGTLADIYVQRYFSDKPKHACTALIPPPATPDAKQMFSKMESADIYLVDDKLMIFSALEEQILLRANLLLPDGELRHINDMAAMYKDKTERLAQEPLKRRFNQEFPLDCEYASAILKIWRNKDVTFAVEEMQDFSTNPIFVRYAGMQIELSDKKNKSREGPINAILKKKEMVGAILLLPDYRLTRP